MSSPGGRRGPAAGSGEIAVARASGKETKARRLGQVFTPDAVADLIASLCIHRPDAVVFDPCVGEGALLLAAGRRLAALGISDWHRQVRGLEVDPETLAAGRRRIADAAGVAPEAIPIQPGDFLALRPPLRGDAGHAILDLEAAPTALLTECDVAVMNPPYTRQERLAAGTKAGSAGLGRRAGLHAYFWMHLARFVRPGGWLGAITPATWLSAEYGRDLRAFLLEQFRIRFLIDFERDVFPDATVEACVAILEKRPGAHEAKARAETPVRFLCLSAGADLPAAAAEAAARGEDGEGPGYRVRVVPQGSLSAGERWSRHFLAPATARTVQTVEAGAASEGTVPLETVARIRRGITTGNNRVFLLDADRAERLGIEDRCLWRIVRSPREIVGLDTEGVERPGLLLLPPGPEGEGSRAAEYLRAQGVAGSDYLPAKPPGPAPLLFGYAVRARKAFFRNSAGLLAGDNFFEVTPRRPEWAPLLFALLNAVPVALLLEMQGRGQGRGLLKVQRYELAALPVAHPARLDPGVRRDLEALGEALRRAPGDEGIRDALDELAARALGLAAADLCRAERDLAARRWGRSQSHGIARKRTEGA